MMKDKMNKAPGLLVTQSEAAQYLGVSRATLAAIAAGSYGSVPDELQRIKLGGSWYYSRSKLEDYARGGHAA